MNGVDDEHSYPVLTINTAKNKDSIGLLDPKREFIGDSEIANFSSFNAIYFNNEPN